MKFIENGNIKNKKVILRCDLNVTIKDGKIIDTTKIKESLKTINYLLENNCSIIIMSHLGKIKSEEDKKNNSIILVKEELEKILKKEIRFSKDLVGSELKEQSNNLNPQEILLLENTRYMDYPEKLESSCNEELSKYWASLGDIFINDAFGTTHRKHASNYGISKYLESYYGYLVEKEIQGLKPVIEKEKPFTVIMGGAKVDDKIKLIKTLIEDCDYIILGGGIANTFFVADGFKVGKSLYSDNYVNEIKEIIDKYREKIILPKKVKVLNEKDIFTKAITEISETDKILDILITDEYIEVLKNSKTIFVNGTIGLYETEEFSIGTKTILKILSQVNGKVIIGGGDALASVNKLGNPNDYYFISTGGGATLEYIANKKLNALDGEKI